MAAELHYDRFAHSCYAGGGRDAFGATAHSLAAVTAHEPRRRPGGGNEGTCSLRFSCALPPSFRAGSMSVSMAANAALAPRPTHCRGGGGSVYGLLAAADGFHAVCALPPAALPPDGGCGYETACYQTGGCLSHTPPPPSEQLADERMCISSGCDSEFDVGSGGDAGDSRSVEKTAVAAAAATAAAAAAAAATAWGYGFYAPAQQRQQPQQQQQHLRICGNMDSRRGGSGGSVRPDDSSFADPTPPEADSRSLVEMRSFAQKFKQRRMKLGATQADVGRALGALRIPGIGPLSQSTICRFESLTLSQSNMAALRPVLLAWLREAERTSQSAPAADDCDGGVCTGDRESAGGGGGDGTAAMLLPLVPRKRKRTSIASPERRSLEMYFAQQPRPTSDRIEYIADRLELAKSVVRVWFCNQRQKQKRLRFAVTAASAAAAAAEDATISADDEVNP